MWKPDGIVDCVWSRYKANFKIKFYRLSNKYLRYLYYLRFK